MIKILIAITLLLIVAIVRLAMSCYRKARDVDYWRKAAQDQRQENSEAETNIDRLEMEYKDATIVALQSEITILEELRYCIAAQQDTITSANRLIAKLKAEISLLTAINEAAIDATADAITH